MTTPRAPTVSVVIPTFNRAPLLRRAISSVLAQTVAPAEVLVVDDGSTDGTARLVAEEFPHTECLRQPNRGVSAARNRGIAAAQGEWLAFLDSDDEWRPAKLERQLAALAASPALRACHTDEVWMRHGRRVNPRRRHAKSGGRIFRRCLALCLISPSAALLHRSLFDELGGFDEQLPACEDYDLWLRLTAREPVAFVAEPLVVKHGGHRDQLSRTVPALDRYRIQALEKILAAGVLGADDWLAARETLVAKIDVYLPGLIKRRRDAEAERYRAKRQAWLAAVPGASGVAAETGAADTLAPS